MRRGSRGVTLVEAVIGLALMGTALLILAVLFSSGTRAYNFAMKQYLVVSNARKAIQGEGSRRGMLSAAMHAGWALSLSTAALEVQLSSGSARYYVSEDSLFQDLLGSVKEQSKAAGSLEVRYYNIGADGRILESTAAVSAGMATVALTMKGGPRNAPDTFFSGAGMRNRP